MTSKFRVRICLTAAVLATVVLAFAASGATSNISERDQQALSTGQPHLHRDGPQGRESEQGRAGLVHHQRRQQSDPDSDRARYLEGQAHPRGSPVLVGSARGRSGFHRQGRDYSDAAVQRKILDGFREKYWQNRVLGIWPSRAKFNSGDRVAIVDYAYARPARGFTSAPAHHRRRLASRLPQLSNEQSIDRLSGARRRLNPFTSARRRPLISWTCQVIGQPEWADDPAYATARARATADFDIFAEIEKCLADKTKFEACPHPCAIFGVPCAPVLSKKEIANEPCAPVAQWLRSSRRSAATT